MPAAMCLRLLLLLMFSSFSLSFTSSGILDIDELNKVHYSVVIKDSPVAQDGDDSGDDVTMVNKFGQKYKCQLPKLKVIYFFPGM